MKYEIEIYVPGGMGSPSYGPGIVEVLAESEAEAVEQAKKKVRRGMCFGPYRELKIQRVQCKY